MAKYVDGFVLTVPTKRLDEYRTLAKKACKIWLKHGALEYRECVGEDMKPPFGIPFPKLAGTRKGEVVIFAWIVYKSRKHRDQVNAKVMKEMSAMNDCDMKDMPFDMKRMSYGGFDIIVEGMK